MVSGGRVWWVKSSRSAGRAAHGVSQHGVVQHAVAELALDGSRSSKGGEARVPASKHNFLARVRWWVFGTGARNMIHAAGGTRMRLVARSCRRTHLK